MKVTLDMVQNDSDAYTYYRQFKHGEVEMDYNAQAHCEKVLTKEQIDEIEYDSDSKKNEGRDKVKNIDKVDDHKDDDTTGNAAATGAGMAVGGAALMLLASAAKSHAPKSGHIGLGYGIAALASSILSYFSAEKYDQAFDDRNTVRNGVKDNVQELNDQSSIVVDNMNLMNDDTEDFNKAMDAHTIVANEQINEIAALQKEITTAEAAGDTARADAARKRLAELQGAGGTVGDEGEINDIKGRLDEYRAISDNSAGMLEGAADIQSFLEEGMPLGIVAKAEGLFLTIAAAYCAMDIGACILGGAKDAGHFDFAGLANGGIGAIMFGVAAVMTGKAAKVISDKGKDELDCYDKSGELDTPISDLEEVTEQSYAYADETEEGYTEGDKNSTNSQNTNQGNVDSDVEHHKDNVKGGSGGGNGGSNQ